MILKILSHKNKLLREKCIPVIPEAYSKFANRMLTTMQAHKAVGLAANQVGKTVRIITISTPDFTGIMFNPEITSKSDDIFNFNEGCLSIKGKFIDTNTRSKTITVKWQDSSGEYNEKEFIDITSVVIQHEVDHLQGILLTDHLEKEDDKKES